MNASFSRILHILVGMLALGALAKDSAAQCQNETELQPGVIVDPDRQRAFVVTAEGTDGLDLTSGQRLWSCARAARPIGFADDFVICQSSGNAAPNELGLVALHAESGVPGAAGTIELPAGVVVVDGPEHSFEVRAGSIADAALIYWRFRHWPSEADRRRDAPASQQQGANRFSVDTGEVATYPAGNVAAVLHRETGPLGERERLEGLGDRQFASIDGLHVLTSERMESEPAGYRFDVYDRASGSRLGTFSAASDPVRFLVAGSRVVYATGGQRDAVEIGVSELSTGRELWRRTLGAAAQPDEATGVRVSEARAMVEERLAGIDGAEQGTLSDLDRETESLHALLGDSEFFSLRFRRFPVAVAPPESLQPNNVFAVRGDEVALIDSDAALRNFLQDRIENAADRKSRVDLATGWLRLTGELHQDGFFEFQEPRIEVASNGVKGTMEVVPRRGDQGELTVEMVFDGGALVQVTTGGKLLPGVRPRCQARRLLDGDPVTRQIMRQDLLVLGSAAKPYLDEVRATAGPELQRAIDAVWLQIVREGR